MMIRSAQSGSIMVILDRMGRTKIASASLSGIVSLFYTVLVPTTSQMR